MLAYLIGLIGVAGGIAALVSNVKAMRVAHDSRRRRVLAICASAVGLALCPLTLLIGVQHDVNRHGPVTHYGWPFAMITSDMYAAEGPILDEIGFQVAFWILVPQVLLYVTERLFKAARQM